MSPNTAALLAMVINLGAYSTEIVRAGVEAIPSGQIEAGRALGLRRFQIVRFIILFQALRAVYPALTSQFILVLLGSSVVSAIAAEELTAIANNINSQTFRSFEIYIIVTIMYVAIVFGFGRFSRLSTRSRSRGADERGLAESRKPLPSCRGLQRENRAWRLVSQSRSEPAAEDCARCRC
jgi:polar amino acid transport system permease protein